jgi:hypothetical protein
MRHALKVTVGILAWSAAFAVILIGTAIAAVISIPFEIWDWYKESRG